MTVLTKVDIRIKGKTHSPRIPLRVWQAFEAHAKSLDWSIAQLAEKAQAESNGTLAQAIEAYVARWLTVYKHATREEWTMDLVEAMRPEFAKRGCPLPEKIRATIAFTSTGHRGKRRGECWSPEMSGDKTTEIMVCLRESDPVEIANILTHELVHAAQFLKAKETGKPMSKGGHGRDFQAIAATMDMAGDPRRPGSEKMKCLRGDPNGAWGTWAKPLIEAAGPMPHSALAEAVAKEKKQTTRMLKLECSDEATMLAGQACGAVWRMSSSHIADKARLSCPCCGGLIVNPHYEGEEVDEDALDTSAARVANLLEVKRSRQGRKSAVQDMLDQAMRKGGREGAENRLRGQR